MVIALSIFTVLVPSLSARVRRALLPCYALLAHTHLPHIHARHTLTVCFCWTTIPPCFALTPTAHDLPTGHLPPLVSPPLSPLSPLLASSPVSSPVPPPCPLQTLFPKGGRCSSYAAQGMAHQYGVTVKKGFLDVKIHFFDLFETSCLNGWTCGNIAAAPTDVAAFYYYLLSNQTTQTTTETTTSLAAPGPNPIVSEAARAEMMHFQPLTTGFAPGLPYGLGLMPVQGLRNGSDTDKAKASLIGHGGEDYGSQGMPGYNAFFDFGFTPATTSIFGMNCSLGALKFTENVHAPSLVSCMAYQIILDIVAGQRNTTAPFMDCARQHVTSKVAAVRHHGVEGGKLKTAERRHRASWREELTALSALGFSCD